MIKNITKYYEEQKYIDYSSNEYYILFVISLFEENPLIWDDESYISLIFRKLFLYINLKYSNYQKNYESYNNKKIL